MEQKLVFEGLRVLDLTRVLAGPLTARLLGIYGAEVIKVESSTAPDIFRTYFPMAKGKSGVNRCGAFNVMNSDDYSITLNLRKPDAMELCKKLVAWADILLENYSPGVMKRMGLGYEDLKKTKPDIIMVSMSLQGQTGPHSAQPGFGTELAALAGITNLGGWPDRVPTGTSNPSTDYMVPQYAMVAIVAALEHRQKTGRGQLIDLAQLELGPSFISPSVLNYTVNRQVDARLGNRSSDASPHGAFPCRGHDRWCSIVVYTDDEWRALCSIMGNPLWTEEMRFATLVGRKKHEDELERLISEWTIQYSPEEVMYRLQTAGVPAGIVNEESDFVEDPQLKYRRHAVVLNHPEIGPHSYYNYSWRLSKTPAEPRRPAPCLGEHTEYVAKQILGISDEEFVRLLNEGVFE